MLVTVSPSTQQIVQQVRQSEAQCISGCNVTGPVRNSRYAATVLRSGLVGLCDKAKTVEDGRRWQHDQYVLLATDCEIDVSDLVVQQYSVQH